jgi:hypothetical protein
MNTCVKKTKKKGQIINTITLKQKVKCHFLKRNDCILEGGKQQKAFSLSFF